MSEDYKSPKLIKLYYMPSTDTSEGRAYLRNMSGSKLAGMFICHNEEQVRKVKNSRNLKLLYNEMVSDKRAMLQRYANNRIAFVGYTSRYVASGLHSNSDSMDKLYIHLSDRVINEEGYDIIKDVISTYRHSVHIDTIIPELANAPIETIDGM